MTTKLGTCGSGAALGRHNDSASPAGAHTCHGLFTRKEAEWDHVPVLVGGGAVALALTGQEAGVPHGPGSALCRHLENAGPGCP